MEPLIDHGNVIVLTEAGRLAHVEEQPLAGGAVTTVVRVGDTVRRSPGPHTTYVRQLLELLQRHGFGGAPRFRGVDERGREVLDFLPGHVAWEPEQPVDVAGDASLARVAELVRAFHDVTVDSELSEGGEVVCHNDLSPRNTVYRDTGDGLRPVAFVDWDIAGPGRRVHDVAHVCWQYVGLGPAIADVHDAARRVRLVCDAYGLVERDELVDTVLWWQDRCWRGIEEEASAGDPAKIALRDAGVCTAIKAAYQWTAERRAELRTAL